MNETLSTALWAWGRGTGVVALVLLSASLVLGIAGRSGRDLLGLGRFGLNEIHRLLALTAAGLIVAHVVSLLLDPYAQLRLVDLAVPFLGAYKPLWLGLGTLAVDITAVVVVVSLLRHRVGPRVFRAVHWSAYTLWPVALAHGIGNGTDGTSAWMLALSAVCALSVGAAVAWRFSSTYAERGHRRVPRTVPRRDPEVVR